MQGQKTICAAMSGGVDSSVMAHLLLAEGYRVTGATMTLYRPGMKVDEDGILTRDLLCGGDMPCGSDEDVRDAKAVCDRLGIPHRVYDFGGEFCRHVIGDFVREYEAGATPNPCIVCNKHLKFGALLEAALADGADGIATGHYARVEYDGGSGRHLLKKAADVDKDQTYVLWQLSQDVLSRVLLPLGGYRKAEIRDMAAELQLATAHKSDSQDICFVPDGDYAAFLTRYTGRVPLPGNYILESGQVLGAHKGIIHYTIGQRKGLGIALGQPMFVKSKDPVSRQIVLTTNDRLFERDVFVKNLNLIATDSLKEPIRCEVKIRYNHKGAPATVIPTGADSAHIRFDEPQRAPADGQSAVFYDGDTVIGGGIIR
jgi:tRNA-specific 2-thiouridylase